MRSFAWFVLILLLALTGAAALNPLLAALLPGQFTGNQFYTTTAKLVAVPLVVWLVIRQRLGGWRGIGYNLPKRAFWRELALGWLGGVLVMLLLCAGLLLLGARIPRPLDETYWIDLARSALAGLVFGLLASFIEETFMRGAVYTSMRRELSILPLAILSGLYFALLHFIRPQPPATPDLAGALEMASGAFWQLATPGAILDSFTALFMASVLLTLLREWRGNIAFVIGVHAGWIFVIKIFKSHSWLLPNNANQWAIGGYDQVTGWLAAPWLALLVAIVYWRLWRGEGNLPVERS